MAISKEQLQQWLADTTSSDEAVVRSATANLECAESIPGFAPCLLMLCTGVLNEGESLAAATYLKNFLRNHWSETDLIPQNERLMFRNQLVDVLLRVDSLVLKVLAEAFRLVVVNDFAQENTWPDLVPALKIAAQNSNLLMGGETLQLKTMNVLVAIQTVVKPFQYFMNPKIAREPVPEQLELVSTELLVPLYGFFHHLVEQAIAARDSSASENDIIILILCKCFHLAVRSHMPISLHSHLGTWLQDFLAFLDTVVVEKMLGSPEEIARMKAWKRALQICCTFVTRHRKYVDKLLPNMTSVVLKIAGRSANAKDVHHMQERIMSLVFDVISNILETGPGWRLMASHFSWLIEGVIFPALRMREKDIVEWKSDEEEYLRKNLPSDLDEISGWRDDLFTPRRSALNLLGLIATSKGPPTSAMVNKTVAPKRKKAGKGGKGKEWRGTAGELLVIPFLSRFALPIDGAAMASESVINYYGVLMAYGGLQEFLKLQRPEHVAMLLQTRVLPLYSMHLPSPFVLSNANWLLGELASCLPEELSKEIYDSLLKALVAPNVGDISWRPVRSSAAGAISALLQEDYSPAEWLPLLQAAVNGARAHEEEEATLSLKLLATAAESADENVLPHIPAIVSAVQHEVSKRIPPSPEPWPQVVESGFSAMAALSQAWDNGEPEEKEECGKALDNWKSGCVVLANTFSELLQRAWLLQIREDAAICEYSPPPSCVDNASVLLASILKNTTEPELVSKWRIEELLQVWSDLMAGWSAWEEEQDLGVFEAIQEAVALHGRFPLAHFGIAAIPPPPAFPVPPRSIIQGIAIFISSAIESAYSAAAWRACRLSHALLHSSAVLFASETITPLLITQFCQSACRRLWQLTSFSVPLAKPLLLVIAMCYACLPSCVMKVFSEETESKEMDCGQALLQWGDALAEVVHSNAEPGLALESEIKLAVMALLKLLDEIFSSNLVQSRKADEFVNKCIQSVLDALIRLKVIQEGNNCGSDDEDEDGNADSDNEDDRDDEDEDDDGDDSDENEKYEETEDQFLERYAQTARELEKEVIDEAEGGEEEDGYELDLGVLGNIDPKASLYSFLQIHGRIFLTERPLPQELVTRFVECYPESCQFLRWTLCQ